MVLDTPVDWVTDTESQPDSSSPSSMAQPSHKWSNANAEVFHIYLWMETPNHAPIVK